MEPSVGGKRDLPVRCKIQHQTAGVGCVCPGPSPHQDICSCPSQSEAVGGELVKRKGEDGREEG